MSVQQAASDCIQLLQAARQWGERGDFKATWIEDSPQYRQIRSIGELVNDEAGLEGMKIVIQTVRQGYRYGYLLDHFWDRIGGWYA